VLPGNGTYTAGPTTSLRRPSLIPGLLGASGREWQCKRPRGASATPRLPPPPALGDIIFLHYVNLAQMKQTPFQTHLSWCLFFYYLSCLIPFFFLFPFWHQLQQRGAKFGSSFLGCGDLASRRQLGKGRGHSSSCIGTCQACHPTPERKKTKRPSPESSFWIPCNLRGRAGQGMQPTNHNDNITPGVSFFIGPPRIGWTRGTEGRRRRVLANWWRKTRHMRMKWRGEGLSQEKGPRIGARQGGKGSFCSAYPAPASQPLTPWRPSFGHLSFPFPLTDLPRFSLAPN
jgi:hypothetical protein